MNMTKQIISYIQVLKDRRRANFKFGNDGIIPEHDTFMTGTLTALDDIIAELDGFVKR